MPADNRLPPDWESPGGAETVYINVQDPRVGVIVYYAVLAYPDRNDTAKRRAFVEAMAARQIKVLSREIGSRRNIPKFYTSYKNEKIQDTFRHGCIRLARRFGAGTIGWTIRLSGRHLAFDQSGTQGLILNGPKTVNSAIRAYIGDRERRSIDWDEHSVANAMHRVWAESLPVLHLVMTNPISIELLQEQLNTGKKIAPKSVDRDIFNSIIAPEWLAKSIADAESLRLILGQELGSKSGARLGRGFTPEKAVRFLATSTP